MTLEEIIQGIEEQYREWGTENIEELDRVAGKIEIKQTIANLIREAAQHKLAATGNPVTAVGNAMKLVATSNFRLGLLVGILLWKPEEPDCAVLDLDAENPDEQRTQATISKQCRSCETSGKVCKTCQQSLFACRCGLGNVQPELCPVCGGAGYLTNNQ